MNQAVGMESPDGGLTFHNGQGIRYTPAVCQRCLRGHGMTQPVSRSGNPHDNAVAESFFGTLKHELVNGRRCGRGGGGEPGHIQAHRALLQHEEGALLPGIQTPRRVRARGCVKMRKKPFDLAWPLQLPCVSGPRKCPHPHSRGKLAIIAHGGIDRIY